MDPKPNEIYQHFKGNLYKIITLAIHSETEEKMVVYQALYGEYQVYVRPLSMFVEKLDPQKYGDVVQEYRFERMNQIIGQENVSPVISGTPKRLKETEESVDDSAEESSLDPDVMKFLEADTYDEKANILAFLHHKITDDMINTMAIAMDVEVNEGEIEQRYEALKNCLHTLIKYECNRIR